MNPLDLQFALDICRRNRGVIGLHRTKRVMDFVQINVGEKVYAVDVKTKEWNAKYHVANDNKKINRQRCACDRKIQDGNKTEIIDEYN
eukprot:167012_1